MQTLIVVSGGTEVLTYYGVLRLRGTVVVRYDAMLPMGVMPIRSYAASRYLGALHISP